MKRPGFLSRAATYTIGTAATLFGLTGCGTGWLTTTPDTTPVNNPVDVDTNGVDSNGVEQPNVIETTAENPLQFWKEDFANGFTYTSSIILERNKHFIDEPVGALILQPETLPHGYAESPILASMECTAFENNMKAQCDVKFYNNENVDMNTNAASLALLFPLFTFRVNGAADQGLEGILSQWMSASAGPEATRVYANVVVNPGYSSGYVPPGSSTELESMLDELCETHATTNSWVALEVPGYNSNGELQLDSNGMILAYRIPRLMPDPSDPTAEGNAVDFVFSDKTNNYIIMIAPQDFEADEWAVVARPREISPNAKAVTYMYSPLDHAYNPIDCPNMIVLNADKGHFPSGPTTITGYTTPRE